MSKDQGYKRAIEKVLADSRINKPNLEILKKYDTQGVFQQITIGTRSQRLVSLHQLALFVKKDFKNMKKEDIENYFLSLGDIQPKTWTVKGSFVKAFFKWLYNSDEYPSNVKWIKTSSKNNNHKLPSDLLTKDELKAMIEATDNNLRDRALITVLYESACRIGEILNIKIKDVIIDQYGSVIMVDGKTGMRRIRLIDSSPDLVKWINSHPKKHYRDSPLFIQFYDTRSHYKTDCKELTDASVKKILTKLVIRSGINKHVHPHLFRHTRLTELARDFSESELKVIAGWTGASKMAAVYIHLTGGDIEKKMLEKRGLLNKENDILTPERVTVRPDQGVKVRPGRGVKVGLGKLTEIPGQKLTVIPEKLTEIHNNRGRPKHIIQGFTLSLYKFIKKHKGVSISDICDISLKKKESVKPILSRLKNYGFIINSKGNWYPTSKEFIP